MEPQENFEENSIKIANYFDDRMSPAEEASFMIELGRDKTLRQQYEEALYVHSVLAKEDQESGTGDNLFFQPADEHVHMIETAIEEKQDNKKQTPVIQFFARYRNIAAALVLLVISGIVILLISRNKINTPPDIVKKPAEEKTIRALKNDTAEKIQIPVLAQQVAADSLFRYFYKTYSASEEDPVEISKYYTDYKKGRYSSVISASEADYRVMGVSNKSEQLKQYLHLYKGLSYLQENKPLNAIQQFDSVLQSAVKNDPQFYQAQWYSLMAFLKKNDSTKALSIATIISKSGSPYKLKAALLETALKGK